MACNMCQHSDGMTRADIDDFVKVDHPINGQTAQYLGATENKQVYICPYCEEYLLKTEIVMLTQKVVVKYKNVGWNKEGIK